MVRCADFYEKWKKDPNWCEKSPESVREIDHYIETHSLLVARGCDEGAVYKKFPAGVALEVLKIKDPGTKEKVLTNAAGMIKRGDRVSKGDIRTWAGLEQPKNNGENLRNEPGKPGSPIPEIPVKSAPSGWHPSVSNCQGCSRLGYEKADSSTKLNYICTAAKPGEGYQHGRPPFGMEKCPLGTGPVKVSCRYWGEDALCHATPETICTNPKTRQACNCPVGAIGEGLTPALDLIRRQGYRNPQTGDLTTAFCRNKTGVNGCSHLKKREMNNTYECELSGKVPGNMRTCPLEDKKPQDEWSPAYEAKYPVTASCKEAGCVDLRFVKVGLHTCQKTGMRPENIMKLPPGCPRHTPEPVQVTLESQSSPARQGMTVRDTVTPPANPNVQRYTVEAGRQDQAAIRQMIAYGFGEDEQEAVQTAFEEGLNLFLDRIEEKINQECDQE